jgi:hypothetical protein
MGLHEEYVAFLAEHGVEPPSQWTKSQLLDGVRKSLNDSREGIRKQAKHVLSWVDAIGVGHRAAEKEDYSEFENSLDLVRRGLELMGIEFPTQLYFGMFPTSVFNARAVRTQSGVLCLLNTGLTSFLYNFSIGCCYAVTEESHNFFRMPSFNATLRSEPRLLTALGIAISVAYQYIAHSAHALPESLPEEYEAGTLTMAAGVAESMKTFVVAHEISHMLLGHLDSSMVTECSVRTRVGEIRALNRSQEQEFAADLLAQRILIAIDQDSWPVTSFIGGGLFFFLANVFVEQLAEKLFHVASNEWSPSDTHPPALNRIDALKKFI